MVLKLVKVLFLAMATMSVGYYVALADSEKGQKAGTEASSPEKKNITK